MSTYKLIILLLLASYQCFFILFILYQLAKGKRVPEFMLFTFMILGFFGLAYYSPYYLANALYILLLVTQAMFFIYVIFFSGRSIRDSFKSVRGEKCLTQLPTVAVVVSLKNEEALVDSLIENLRSLDYPRELLTIAIIDDHSSDNTYQRLMQWEGNGVLITRRVSANLYNNGKASALNELIRSLDQELVCVFDADSKPQKDFLLKAVNYFSNETVGMVQGRNVQMNYKKNLITLLTTFDLYSMQFSIYYPVTKLGFGLFEGRGGIFRREAFTRCGCFDESLPGEDLDLAYRFSMNGWKTVFATDLLNFEFVTQDAREWLSQRLRWLGNDLMACIKNIPPLLRSPEISFRSKFAGAFFLVNIFWFLMLNITGLIGCLELFQPESLVNWNYFLVSFVALSTLFLASCIFWLRKLYFILLMPLMLFYYWMFSILLTWVFIHQVILKLEIRYIKARYYSKL